MLKITSYLAGDGSRDALADKFLSTTQVSLVPLPLNIRHKAHSSTQQFVYEGKFPQLLKICR
jgi:hypothetical protein